MKLFTYILRILYVEPFLIWLSTTSYSFMGWYVAYINDCATSLGYCATTYTITTNPEQRVYDVYVYTLLRLG